MQVAAREGQVLITCTRPGGAAAAAEPYLRVGDRIVSINSRYSPAWHSVYAVTRGAHVPEGDATT